MTPALVVTQKTPEGRLGRSQIPFEVVLDETLFQQFLENVPEGSKTYYRDFSETPNVVRIVMPEEYFSSFELSDPEGTLKEMLAHSLHNENQVQAAALQSLLKIIS